MTRPSVADPFEAGPEHIDRESRQQRVRAVLMTYCTPQLKYDGMSAWEIAGKILAVLDEPVTP
jgi:hypothetical protein